MTFHNQPQQQQQLHQQQQQQQQPQQHHHLHHLHRQGKATNKPLGINASSTVILLIMSFLVGASLVSSSWPSARIQQQTNHHHQGAPMEQQLEALASHLSASIPSALSLANIRQQLVEAASAAGNESLARQLDETLLETDYMKLFSVGFERLLELAESIDTDTDADSDSGSNSYTKESCVANPTPNCTRSKRTKRATAEEDAAGLNQTTELPELIATEPMESVVLAPGLPRPPNSSLHRNAGSTLGKKRQRPINGDASDRQQQSINELGDKSPGEHEIDSTKTSSTSAGLPQGSMHNEAISFQPEAGSPDSDASSFALPLATSSKRRPEHSAKLSIIQVPAPEQNPLRLAEATGKSSLSAADTPASLDAALDNLDAASLPDLSSILGQIQTNADLENLDNFIKQFNNGTNSQMPLKQQLSDRQAWEPQLGSTDALDAETLRSLSAPYVALDARKGSSPGEFSVRQGALQEENQPSRYSSQFGPIYSSSTGKQNGNMKLPAPLGSNQRSRNQRGSGNSASKKEAQSSVQWTRINNNNNNEIHSRRLAPETPVYPDSIQQQLYGTNSGVRSTSSKLVRGPQESRYQASGSFGAQQQHGASNHHPRIIPMNYASEQAAAVVQGNEELPPAQFGQQSQVLGLLQVAAPVTHHQHHQQHQQQQQRLRRTARRASPLLLAATSPLESALRGHHGGLSAAGAHHADYLHLYPAWPATGARYSSGKGGQRSYQHRIGHGEETAATIATTSTTDPMWTDTHQHDDDYQQSPQTIQITAVPNGLGLVGNGLAGLNGWNGFAGGFNGFNGWNGGLAGGPWAGRQVLLVNKQPTSVGSGLEWRSWLIPVAIILALPLVLGALFVPVFLKSVMFLIQILQMLGILMPPSQLASHLLSGATSHSQQSG